MPYVKQHERSKYEALGKELYSDFTFSEFDQNKNKIPTKAYAEYFPILYIEPLLNNQNAIGFNLGADLFRLQTLLKARDTNQQLATPPLNLVQDLNTPSQYSHLLLNPVYKKGTSNNTSKQRRENIAGYTSGVFSVDKIHT